MILLILLTFLSVGHCTFWDNFTSNIAIIIVDTHGQNISTKDVWIDAHLKVIDNIGFIRNNYGQHPFGPKAYEGVIVLIFLVLTILFVFFFCF
jgi:hypothetical protein